MAASVVADSARMVTAMDMAATAVAASAVAVEKSCGGSTVPSAMTGI
jgi:hypothetical protein